MNRKGPILLLGSVICLVLLGFLWNEHRTTSSQTKMEEGSTDSEIAKEGFVSTGTLSAAGEGSSLPSVDQPLRLIVGRLEELAEKGEPSAMCRLAVEYSFCRAERERANGIRSRISTLQDRLANGEGEADRASMESELKGLQAVSATLATGAQHCEGVGVPSAGERLNLLRSAALKGHVPSMSLYSRGEGFDWAEMFNQLDAMKRFRSEAERIAIEAAKQGDLESLFALAAAYAPPSPVLGKSFLGQVVKPNPELSLSYLLQLRAIYSDGTRPDSAQAQAFIDRQVKLLSSQLSQVDLTRAQTQAGVRLAEWKRPDKDARVFIVGITASPSPNMLREQCDAGGDQVGSGVYVVPPES